MKVKAKKTKEKELKQDQQKNVGRSGWSIAKSVLTFAKPYRVFFVFSIIFVLIASVVEAFIPILIGRAIDGLVASGLVDFKIVLKYALMIIGAAVLFSGFDLSGEICLNRYFYRTTQLIRDKYFEKISKVPIKYIDKSTHGDLLNRMINDINIMTDGFLESVISVLNGLFTLVSTIAFMYILNVQIATIILILTPLSFLVTLYIAKKSQNLFNKKAEIDGELSGYLEEYISGQRVVKAFGHEGESFRNFKKINQKRYEVAHKSEFMSTITIPITRLINHIVYTIVGLVGILLCFKGEAGMSVGIITSFLTYANSFGKPFDEITDNITDLQAGIACGRRVFAVLDEEDEVSDAYLPAIKKTDGSIELKNISFSYVKERKLLQNLNVKVKPGQKVAIVGPTGCGKTTIINLLMRFYDVDKGAILIQGHDIREIKRKSLRQQYGMVLQESWLFSATVAQNIAYGKKNATKKEIIEAAKQAGAYDFIMQMTNGFDTVINEGANNVSAGQRQLLCIARIMLMDPAILILDEATSNIDTRTEQKIQQAFDLLMKKRTSFVIAHRLSTITNADLILVMNKGNVIETGTHKELLAKKGFYANLYNSQFEK